MELKPKEQQSYKAGMKLLWPGFASSSKDISVARRFGDTIFEIDCDGQGITYNTEVEDISEYPSEKEILFYPYSGFKVVEEYKDGKIKLETCDTLIVESS